MAGSTAGRSTTRTWTTGTTRPAPTSQTRKLVLQDNVFAIFQALGTPTHLVGGELPQLRTRARPLRGIRLQLLEQHVPVSGHLRLAARLHHRGQDPRAVHRAELRGQEGRLLRAGTRTTSSAQTASSESTDALQGKGLNVDSTPAYYTPTAAGAMAVGAAIAQLQAQGVQVIVSFSIPLFTAIAEASAAGLHYHPQFVVSNVGSDPPTLSAILTGGALGNKLPAGADRRHDQRHVPAAADRRDQPVDHALQEHQGHVRAVAAVGRQRPLRHGAGVHVRAGAEGGGAEPDPSQHHRRRADQSLD